MADRLLGGVIAKRYRLTEQIGRGSFGRVYAAEELSDGEVIGRVAVKLLTPDAAQRRLVLREIEALTRLRDPHVLAYQASGEFRAGIDDVVYVVTELAEGTLADVLTPGATLPLEQAAGLAMGMAQALAYLHGEGLVHRDVKPANVFRVGEVWKLGDFGLVREVGGRSTTATGIMGTFGYMAPEMFQGRVGPASDVYAMGVTLLEALTGQPAHVGSNQAELVNKVLTEPAAIPDTLPEPYRGLVERCLEKDPTARPHAAEVPALLEDGSAPAGPPPTVVAAGPASSCPGGSAPAAARWAAPARRAWVVAAALLVLGLTLVAMAVRGPAARTVTNPKDGSVLVLVPAGEFEMGDGRDSDCPRHRVYLDAYYIGRYCVTNRQYAQFVAETGHRSPEQPGAGMGVWKNGGYPAEKANHPVTHVDWDDAQAYAVWAGLALPTEAQWEKAARGPSNTVYPWGEQDDARRSRLCDSHVGYCPTVAVTAYRSRLSRYGTYQQSGNVWEWCADWYSGDYYLQSPRENPAGPTRGWDRVRRGGSGSRANEARAAYRRHCSPRDREDGTLGFRLVRAAVAVPQGSGKAQSSPPGR